MGQRTEKTVLGNQERIYNGTNFKNLSVKITN